MSRFMRWRREITPDLRGVSIGNTWGDWLNVGEATPIEYIDAAYHALDAKLMAEMAAAIDRPEEAQAYEQRFRAIRDVFQRDYVKPDGTLTIDSQTAYVLALSFGLIPEELMEKASGRLAEKIAANDYRMTTGFLGTKPLLPTLSATGHHDLAVRLFQSRKFPSWGYEVINGATTVWERWDSYTKEDGFGRHNAAMNSFSHYAFGAVTEWMFDDLAGIDTDGPGFRRITIRPGPPTADSNPDQEPIDWVKAQYNSVRGKIVSDWQREGDQFKLHVVIPPGTTATVYLPARSVDTISEGDRPVSESEGVTVLGMEGDRVILTIGSGSYEFKSTH